MRSVLLGAAWVIGVVVVLIVLLWVFQRRLIYLPDTEVEAPGRVLPGAEDVAFPTRDGLILDAWFVPGRGADNATTIVVFPGNAGNRSGRAPLAAALVERGFSVLLMDYRGYGGNPGAPTEGGLHTDGLAAIEYLGRRSDVDPSRVAYFGESLGAAVALSVAAEKPPAALVLRSPFTSLADAAAVHYPFLPVSVLLWDSYDNVGVVQRLDIPVLVVAGDADATVPFDQSEAVFEASPAGSEFLVIPGADHNDPELSHGPLLAGAVERFVGRVAAGG